MSDTGSLRGVGRAASGPLVATWQICDWLRLNGPADREVLIAECARFVDPAYARRWYERQLARNRKVHKSGEVASAKTKNQVLHSAPQPMVETLDAGKASRAVLVHLLKELGRRGQITREGDIYTLVRMPRLPKGHTAEQLSTDPVVQRRAIITTDAVRALRSANRRGMFTRVERTRSSVSLTNSEREPVLAWLATWDDVDELPPEYAVLIPVLRDMRDRQADSASPKNTNAEAAALEVLWKSLDHYA